MSSTPARRPIPASADAPPTSRPVDSNQHNAVTLGPRDRVIGQIYIEGDLRVSGIVEGEVEVTGDVAIDDLAKVKASVTGRDISISGQVVGAVIARKRLEVTRSGSLIGDVRVARLTIQDGATFSGKVSMGAAAEAPVKATEAKPVMPEPKPAVVEPKPVAPEPQAASKPAAPIVATPMASPPAAKAPTPPLPAAKAPIVAPPAAKAPIVAPVAAKPSIAPLPAAKAPAPPPATVGRSDGKGGKGKTQQKKGKPKRR
ncbi:MAG TPA: polymer-forming cytoskeletal protein [Candidatus Dormibacteraeota bacterium]